MIDAFIIYDEKISSKNQCETLVNELRKKKKIKFEYLIIKKKPYHYLPNVLIYFILNLINFFRITRCKNYNLILSCGRTAAPYNLFFSKKNYTQSYHILDPYFRRDDFTNIIIPYHDQKKMRIYKNTIFTVGALSKKISFMNKEKSQRGKKVISFLIGGSGKSSQLTIIDIKGCLKVLNKLKNRYIINYCFSRRTPEKIKEYIIKHKYSSHICYPKGNLNPYSELLESSNFFIVTQDSVGMISDVLNTGKSIYIVELQNIKTKLKDFTEFLIKKKYAKIFNGKFEKSSYKSLNEVKRVANHILKNFTNDCESKSIDLDTF
jgi:mitochondrial fission protein ELM1